MNTSRDSSLAIRSSSRWRKRVSVSVRPWCFSGGGRSDFASSVTSSSETVSSPARERMIVPSAPTMSPRSARAQPLERLLAEHVEPAEQLDAPRAVDEVGEDRLALAALGGEAAGDAHARLGLAAGLEVVVALARLRDRDDAGELVRERVDAGGAQLLELAPPGGEDLGLTAGRPRQPASSLIRRRSW